MSKLKIGLVDLDTSHPAAWVPVIRALGHEVIGVYDSGDVYAAGYSRTFAAEHNIAGVYDSPEEMADDVDLVIIHSCNWDAHVRRAAPFAAAGKSIFFDKPVTGNFGDLTTIQTWKNRGLKIAGGSSLPFCREAAEYRAAYPGEKPLFVYAGCSVDEFNYGIHAYALMLGLMGTGVCGARHLSSHTQDFIELSWEDGRIGIVGVGRTSGYLPFFATITTQTGVRHIQVDNAGLYRAMLERVLPYYAGEADDPLPDGQFLEAERAALGALLSKQSGGRRIALSELAASDSGYDGAAFAAAYKALKTTEQ